MSQGKMKTDRICREYPLRPDQMVNRITSVFDLFVLAHVGIPDIETAEDWSLTIDGLVNSSINVDFTSLRRDFDKTVIEAVHKCAGNPRKPTVPTRQVANVRWGGVLLEDLLKSVDIQPEAQYLWSYGMDHGEYFGHAIDPYVKDVPRSRIDCGDVLLAYELNNEPLPLKHGFPLRLVIPGYYGNNDVKWLSRLHFAAARTPGPFTTIFYNDELPNGKGTKPCREIEPESIFVTPRNKVRLPVGEVLISGWAWSNCEVKSVEVSVDGGQTWSRADLESRRQQSWRRFNYRLYIERPRQVQLLCRATDVNAQTQPISGARNECHAITINLVVA